MSEKAKVYRFGKVGAALLYFAVISVLVGMFYLLELLPWYELLGLFSAILIIHGLNWKNWSLAFCGIALFITASHFWWVQLWPYTQIP